MNDAVPFCHNTQTARSAHKVHADDLCATFLNKSGKFVRAQMACISSQNIR